MIFLTVNGFEDSVDKVEDAIGTDISYCVNDTCKRRIPKRKSFGSHVRIPDSIASELSEALSVAVTDNEGTSACEEEANGE